ncbi:DUF6802 family protein [Nocardia sp. NPDC058658]|uniref:DUF6802 family protein n=1 Tax=Nocardia sp. NPDC058658 TaxID=3346580 RepID=UPI00365649AD
MTSAEPARPNPRLPLADDKTSIWSDYDHDGLADHVTVVEEDGDYAAWEYHRHPDGTSEWRKTDQGNLEK